MTARMPLEDRSKLVPGPRVRSRCLLVGLGVLALLAATLDARPAAARVPRVLRAGTHPFVFKFGIGPSLRLDDIPTQFKMSQEFGYHFMGRSAGPALGFVLGESFGDDVFTFQLGPTFWWDIQPVSNLGLYLAPMFHIGYSLINYDHWRNVDVTYHFFDMLMGFEVSLILGDRGVIFFRPFGINMFIGDFFGVRYDLVFGGGVTF